MNTNLHIVLGGNTDFNQKVKTKLFKREKPNETVSTQEEDNFEDEDAICSVRQRAAKLDGLSKYNNSSDLIEGLQVYFSETFRELKHNIGIYTIDTRALENVQNIFLEFGKWLGTKDKHFPLTVLFIAKDEQLSELHEGVKKHHETWKYWQHFLHFMTLTEEGKMGEVFDKIISLAVALSANSSFDKSAVFDPENKSLFTEDKNVVHILAEMDQGSAFNRLANEIGHTKMFVYLEGKDDQKKTPPLLAAINQCDVSLGAILNYYCTNLNLLRLNKDENETERNIVNQLLHSTDDTGNNLTYYVIQNEKKPLSAFGTILQIEKNFHMEKGDSMDEYLEVQKCIQNFLGSTKETVLALKLMENTIETSTCSKWTQIMLAILMVCIVRVAIYMGDVVTDALVGNAYYIEWVNQSSFEISDNITLRYYPTQLTAGWKTTYTLLFMCLPCIFYLVELIRYIIDIDKFSQLESSKIIALVLTLPITVPLWPVFLMTMKAIYLVKFHVAKDPGEKAELKKTYKDISKRTGVVFLSEVCIQSSFQPILQWYILLPEFLIKLNIFLKAPGEENSTVFLLAASFISSVLSLAWSITSYSASLKSGALSFTSDPISRIVLFFSNLLMIFARINCIILFMYYFGPGKFYPGMIAMVVHILLMAGVHLFTLVHYVYPEHKTICYKKALYVSFLNGLGNIFVNTFIHVEMDTQKYLEQKYLEQMKKRSFFRQVFGHLIFLIENIIFIILGCLTDVEPLNDPTIMTKIVSAIFVCQITGVLLKIFYYKFLHIWKDLTVKVTSKGLLRGNEVVLPFHKKNQTESIDETLMKPLTLNTEENNEM